MDIVALIIQKRILVPRPIPPLVMCGRSVRCPIILVIHHLVIVIPSIIIIIVWHHLPIIIIGILVVRLGVIHIRSSSVIWHVVWLPIIIILIWRIVILVRVIY